MFYGVGVNAICYGDYFRRYATLKGQDHPVYVGETDPDNLEDRVAVSRRGANLCARLNEHTHRIHQAILTLGINDFECVQTSL